MEYIVKYPNRKLYSKKENTYVKLDYILDLVKLSPYDFKIVEFDNTKDVEVMQDITAEVLRSAIKKEFRTASRKSLTEFIRSNVWIV